MKNHFDLLLSALDSYPDAMNPSSLHGFLTALAIGPDEALEQPWPQEIVNILPETILSETMAALENKAMFAFDQIIDELAERRFYPRIKNPDKGNKTAKAWCHGFQQAILLAETEWKALHEESPDAARKCIMISALLKPEIAEAAFGIPPEKHDAFVTEQTPLLGSIIEAYYQSFIDSGVTEIEDIDIKPPTMEDLPQFSKEELTGKNNDELLHLLCILDDALPYEIILECIQRKTPMVEMLNQYLADDKHWDEAQDSGEDSFWTRLHAIMILGGIPGEMAGQGLISALNRMNSGDDLLWDWLAGYWPALFRNKPEATHQALHAIAEDTKLDWYTRHHATESILAYAASKSQKVLEQALDWLAELITAEDEEKEFRYMGGNTLLDFAPKRHRPLLEKLADLQKDAKFGACFARSDINRTFNRSKITPEWERFNNPWEFYDPKNILERQQRWHSEEIASHTVDEEEDQDEAWQNYHSMAETLTREQPKVRRNDSCPCGSGKKYKKCCLH